MDVVLPLCLLIDKRHNYCLKKKSKVFMNLASCRVLSADLLRTTCSEPAKLTMSSFERMAVPALARQHSRTTVKMQWMRLEDWSIFVRVMVRLVLPQASKFDVMS